VAFDWLADPAGFVYQAERTTESWPIGSEVKLEPGLILRAEAPFEARFKLVRDGDLALESSGPGIEFLVDKPGVYRIEVWLSLAGEDWPWILTNPIYVRGTN
jgi:hypothetical protein